MRGVNRTVRLRFTFKRSGRGGDAYGSTSSNALAHEDLEGPNLSHSQSSGDADDASALAEQQGSQVACDLRRPVRRYRPTKSLAHANGLPHWPHASVSHPLRLLGYACAHW